MNLIYNDYALPYAMGFQDPGSQQMYSIINLHDNIVYYLIIICTIVLQFFLSLIMNKEHLPYLIHGNLIELFQTCIPAIILQLIGIPSLQLIYLMDEILSPEITIKAIASQQFQTYEYSDYSNEIKFDSFLIPTDDLLPGDLRQLTLDNNLVLPINTSIRILISSNDVLHSFAVPALGLKCDAMPGRLNALGIIINRPSLYHGQCSELCGNLHSAMPITIEAVNLPKYITQIKEQL